MAHFTFREDWERSYRAKFWDFLKSGNEIPRYSVIAGYLRSLCPTGGVLDLGCGEGLLYDYLSRANIPGYVGVDWSAAALGCLAQRHRGIQLAQSDIQAYSPDPQVRFAAIVFNEVLYYLRQPVSVLQRYTRFMMQDAVIIISMYSHNRLGEESQAETVRKIWSSIEREPWAVLSSVKLVAEGRNQEWRIQVLRLRS